MDVIELCVIFFVILVRNSDRLNTFQGFRSFQEVFPVDERNSYFVIAEVFKCKELSVDILTWLKVGLISVFIKNKALLVEIHSTATEFVFLQELLDHRILASFDHCIAFVSLISLKKNFQQRNNGEMVDTCLLLRVEGSIFVENALQIGLSLEVQKLGIIIRE